MIQVRPASEGKCRWLLPAVEIFHDGTFDTNIGTLVAPPNRLAEAVRNFRIFRSGERPCLIPGIGIGHDDGTASPMIPTAMAGDDSVESYGEVLRLWTKPTEFDGEPKTLLVADLGLYGDETADWVRQGNLSRVSAELDEQPPVACVGGEGLTLVRVALLGFAPPFLKRLKGLPTPLVIPSTQVQTFSYSGLPSRVRCVRATPSPQRGEGRRERGRVFVFSDVPRIPRKTHTFSGESGMNRDAAIQWLQQNGIDPASIGIDDSTPEPLVVTIVQLYQQLAEQQAKTGGGDGTGSPDDTAQFSDDAADDDDPNKPKDKTAMMSGTKKFSQINARIQQLERRLAANDARQRTHERFQARQRVTDRVQSVHKFCDRMVAEKKLQPADCDTASPFTEKSRLLRMAEQAPKTFKFSDKGQTVERDELEVQFEAIERRAPFRFSQQIAGNGQQPSGGAKSHEERYKGFIERRKAEVGARNN